MLESISFEAPDNVYKNFIRLEFDAVWVTSLAWSTQTFASSSPINLTEQNKLLITHVSVKYGEIYSLYIC